MMFVNDSQMIMMRT